jgi:hypothetical protein
VLPEGGGCFARVQGAQVDTILTLNRADKMVLSPGHPDWKISSGVKDISLQIDQGAPHSLQAMPVVNFLLVLITDDGMVADLLKARRLSWDLPTGHVNAEVAGLGVAFAAIRACTPHGQTP